MPRANGKPKKQDGASNDIEDEYDWNIRARCFEVIHDGRPSADGAAHSIQWPEDDDLPEDGDNLSLAKVKKYNLNHGDLLRFDDYRFGQTFFVYRTPKGKYKYVENPDESGSGHLTVPGEILHYVTDAVEKYVDLLNSGCLIFHPSNEDKFVKNKLGEGVPDSWDFSVTYNCGQRDTVVVTRGDRYWECDDWDNATLDDIKEFFSGGKEGNTKFVVKIDLKGDKLKEYKDKHSKKSLVWFKAFAKLPKTWKVEKGAMGMGSTHYRTEWICKGPKVTKDVVKTAIEEFFEGFEASVEEQGV